MTNQKTIIKVLPRHPYPIYSGQARLAYYRAKELTKLGHKVALFSFSFKDLKSSEKEFLNCVFHEVIHVKI